jgi:signal transduction histidine kinase
MLKKPGLLGQLNADQLEAVDSIYRSAIRLERLIGDVLDVQKLALGKMTFNKEKFRVDEFMTTVFKDFNPMMADKKIEFVNSTKETSIIMSDKNRIYQVCRNLISNAVDFVPEHGRIEISSQKDNNNMLFKVKDNGVGIPKDKQTNLFKKFYQADTSAKRKHGGTGLGLSICKGIVEGIGGKIWLKSEEGKGTTFYFSIPLDT